MVDGRRAENGKPYFPTLEVEWEIDNGSIYSASGGVCSGSDPGNGCSSKSSISASFDMTLPNMAPTVPEIHFEHAKTVPKGDHDKKDIGNEDSGVSPEAALSIGSGEACIGLGLGKRTYFKDFSAEDNTKISPLSSATASSTSTVKKTRASRKNTQVICCQVEGCNLDLTNAKDYHRKHKVCESHSKCPKVIVAGLERRFCQQCSRFHGLAEFDQKKRSCRRRLSDHNARRRKPPPEMISFSTAKISSSFYDDRHQINFLSHRSPFDQTRSFPASSWDSSSMFQLPETKEPSMRWAQVKGVRQPSLPLNEMPSALFDIQYDANNNQANLLSSSKGETSKFLNQGVEASLAASNLDGAPDLPRALSLLSNDSWVPSDPGPSLNQIVHMEQSSIFPEVHLMHSSSDSWPMEAPSDSRSKLPLSSYNNAVQFQQFQLLKPACERTSLNLSQIFLGNGRKP